MTVLLRMVKVLASMTLSCLAKLSKFVKKVCKMADLFETQNFLLMVWGFHHKQENWSLLAHHAGDFNKLEPLVTMVFQNFL